MQWQHGANKNRVRVRSTWLRASAALLMVLVLLPSAVGQYNGPPPLYPIEPLTDDSFLQEFREPFVPWEKPVENAAAAVCLDFSGALWSTGPWGVRRLANGKWQAPQGDELNGPAFALASEGQVLWVAAWDGLYRIENGKLVRTALAGQPLGLVKFSDGRLFAGGPRGLSERTGGKWKPAAGLFSHSLTDVAAAGDTLWVATRRGLFEFRDGNTRRVFEPSDIASGNVRSLAVASDRRMWIGSSGGIDVYQNGKRVAHYGGAEGLPCTDVHRLKFDAQGVLWVATARGLGRFDAAHWTWRHSLRWLPDDNVSDMVLADDGTAYVATNGGLAILKRNKMTLADKAEHYERLVRARHVRPPGLVEQCILKQPGDLSSYAPIDTDNDGEYTGLYVAAESFRYAVTHSKQAAESARESYRGMEFLQTVTDTPGFVARTVVPSNWTQMADRNRTYMPQQVAAEQVANPRFKRVENRWRKSRDGKWLWKGDTSSDEITGHYFAYALYYDLVADCDERQRVAQLVRRITDHIIDGGYTLRDIDGKPTLWGVWAPERLLDDPDWQPERGCNSVEILSYLAVAHHITGDEKYLRELARLFDEKRYCELILRPKLSAPSEFTYIDDELLALSYRGLLAYDREPARRAAYLESIRRWFDVIRRDHSPLYAFVFGGVIGKDFGAKGCLAYLRDSPLDMIDWTVDNRSREDVRLVRLPVIEDLQTDRLLPPSERRLNKWDGNPYDASGGSGGTSESSSVHWLLPYWMGRYYGFIK